MSVVVEEQVLGSKGDVYRVTMDEDGEWDCRQAGGEPCPGFFYRGSCSHITKAQGRTPQRAQPRAQSRSSAASRAQPGPTQQQRYQQQRAAWDQAEQQRGQEADRGQEAGGRVARGFYAVAAFLDDINLPLLADTVRGMVAIGRGIQRVAQWANRHDEQFREWRAERAEQREEAWKETPTGRVQTAAPPQEQQASEPQADSGGGDATAADGGGDAGGGDAGGGGDSGAE
jgi:hypothetical protein